MGEHQGSIFDSRELLQLVIEKLSSQALLFGLAVVILLITAVSILGSGSTLIVAAILFIFLITITAYLFFEQRHKAQQGDPKTMSALFDQRLNQIHNDSESFDLKVWIEPQAVNTSARDINIAPRQTQNQYRVGDKIIIAFRASQDCYLTLLNIGSSGKLLILFPNALHQDNFIRANQVYRIPDADYGFEYQLQGPSGIETLKAIATEKSVELVESNFSADGDFFETKTPQVAARDITIIKSKTESAAPQSWADASCKFSVV